MIAVDPAARAVLDDAIAHLAAARSQRLPSDDAIIAGHIDAAHDLLTRLMASIPSRAA